MFVICGYPVDNASAEDLNSQVGGYDDFFPVTISQPLSPGPSIPMKKSCQSVYNAVMYKFIKVNFHLPRTVWLETLLNDQTISTLSNINDKPLLLA